MRVSHRITHGQLVDAVQAAGVVRESHGEQLTLFSGPSGEFDMIDLQECVSSELFETGSVTLVIDGVKYEICLDVYKVFY